MSRVIILATLMLTACSEPVLRSPIEAPSIPGCEGWRFDAVRQGDTVSIGVKHGGELWLIDFESGVFAPPSELVTGGDPALSAEDGRVYPRGAIESPHRCVVERWGSGVCWSVRGE